MTSRNILIAAVALLAGLALTAGAPARAQDGAVTEVGADEHVLGDAEAPITIIEYASLTCPHCASFHRETLPQLKDEWIEPGKARLVYRHYPLDRVALRAAVITECLDDQRFFGFVDVLFQHQQRWARAEEPTEALGKLGRLAGMSEERMRACAEDEAAARRILERQVEARESVDVTSTPTFLVDGEKLVGAQPYETFETLLERLDSQS